MFVVGSQSVSIRVTFCIFMGIFVVRRKIKDEIKDILKRPYEKVLLVVDSDDHARKWVDYLLNDINKYSLKDKLNYCLFNDKFESPFCYMVHDCTSFEESDWHTCDFKADESCFFVTDKRTAFYHRCFFSLIGFTCVLFDKVGGAEESWFVSTIRA